ncbi:MAG: hypothetical protein ABI617_02865 [Sphingomicrobium sp.]
MRRLTPTQIGLIIAAVLILVFAIWTASSTRRANPDKLPDGNATATRTASPQQTCAAQSTYDLIKRELFRRAAALRGSDQAAFDKLAAYAVVRVDRPLLASEDEATGAVGCTGSLTLDLPPGVAVVGGRRTLAADIGYTVQGAADGNGQVLTLTSADAIVTPLATLARIGGQALDPLAPAPKDPLAPGVELPPATGGEPLGTPPPVPEAPTASPSFNCTNARTRGEIAVCRNDGLAALDRQMAAQYGRAVASSDRRTRAELERSRGRFLSFRDQCPSDECIADTYRGRIREIRDIVDEGGR